MAVGIAAEVKNRLSVVDVIGETVQLKKSGASYKGLCPFHDEKTPSFNVNVSRNTFHCFGCGEGGDVISFLMKIDGMTFAETVERLADKYGVQLKRDEGEGFDDRPRGPSRGKLIEAHRVAQEFYAEQLRTPEAAVARFRPIPDQPTLAYIADHVAATSIRPAEGGWTWKFDPRVFARDHLTPELLTRLDCRVALFRAEHGLVTPQQGEVLYDRLGRVAPVIEIPVAGHHIMLDQPVEGWPRSPVLWFLVQGELKLMRRQSDPVLSDEQTTTLLAALLKFLDQEGLKPLHPTETLH